MSCLTIRKRNRSTFVDMKSLYASVECVARRPASIEDVAMRDESCSNSAGLMQHPPRRLQEGLREINNRSCLWVALWCQKHVVLVYANARRRRSSDAQYVRLQSKIGRRWRISLPPRMSILRWICKIARLFKFRWARDIFPYSIDEGFIDLTSSLNYFVPDDALSRRKSSTACLDIQRAIWKRRLRIYSTDWNVERESLLAKLALDNEAKKIPHMPTCELVVWRCREGLGDSRDDRLLKLKLADGEAVECAWDLFDSRTG